MSAIIAMMVAEAAVRQSSTEAQSEIRRLRRELHRARKSNTDQESRIQALETEVEDTEILLATLVRMLVLRGALSQEDLAPFIEALEDPIPAESSGD